MGYLEVRDISRFAQVTRRQANNAQSYLLETNAVYYTGDLLSFAAKNGLLMVSQVILKALTQLGLGHAINRRHVIKIREREEYRVVSPLCITAAQGYTKLVKLLLESGAKSIYHGKQPALVYAIGNRHVGTAKELSRGRNMIDIGLVTTRRTALQLACREKLTSLVKYYLQRHRREGTLNLHECNAALRLVVRQDIRGDPFSVHPHEDVYKIVSMLLRHGADPTIVEDLYRRHPDVHTRDLIEQSLPKVGEEESYHLEWLFSPDQDSQHNLQTATILSQPTSLPTQMEGIVGTDHGANTHQGTPDAQQDQTREGEKKKKRSAGGKKPLPDPVPRIFTGDEVHPASTTPYLPRYPWYKKMGTVKTLPFSPAYRTQKFNAYINECGEKMRRAESEDDLAEIAKNMPPAIQNMVRRRDGSYILGFNPSFNGTLMAPMRKSPHRKAT
ncbi:unnamed protein product [Periconia digitata]|uniref:Ankyrin repeat protein n=1 Tax=Periconia digitata TaxID=1303443 RepID=A0A9W4UD88_9PLEO|nr:unnamed protein product [Periconia digitata]